MFEDLVEELKSLRLKLGIEITTERELEDYLLNRIILPYLRSKYGLIADVKLVVKEVTWPSIH